MGLSCLLGKSLERWAWLVVFACVGLTPYTGAAPAEEAQNLIKNPGFEEIDKATKLPRDWAVIDWSGKKKPANPKLEICEDARTGKVAVRIRRLGQGTNILLAPRLSKKIQGEHTLRLKFYYKGGAEQYIYASMYTTAPDKKKLQYIHSKQYGVAKDWTEAVFEFKTDPATHALAVWVRTPADGFIVDDVSLEEIPAAPKATP